MLNLSPCSVVAGDHRPTKRLPPGPAPHVREVIRPFLQELPLPAKARMISSRYEKLDEADINRAGIESAAESIRTAFLRRFSGRSLPARGRFLYRVSNTLDSMVGHRDAKYERMEKYRR